MDRAEKRFFYSFLAAFLLHAFILGLGLFLTGTVFKPATSDEIYETSDVVEDLAQQNLEPVAEPVQGGTKPRLTNLEFIVLDTDTVKNLFGRSQQIARQVQDEKLKKARKTIPVVKNPPTKPKLIAHTPVPYPQAAGGATGTVLICVLVGFDGRPEYVSTAESSGNRFLDAAAVDHCISWRFTPAKDNSGRIVRCLVYIPVAVH